MVFPTVTFTPDIDNSTLEFVYGTDDISQFNITKNGSNFANLTSEGIYTDNDWLIGDVYKIDVTFTDGTSQETDDFSFPFYPLFPPKSTYYKNPVAGSLRDLKLQIRRECEVAKLAGELPINTTVATVLEVQDLAQPLLPALHIEALSLTSVSSTVSTFDRQIAIKINVYTGGGDLNAEFANNEAICEALLQLSRGWDFGMNTNSRRIEFANAGNQLQLNDKFFHHGTLSFNVAIRS